MNESDTGDAKCCTMVASGRKVAGAIRSLVNAMGLQLESLLLPVFMYGSETEELRESCVYSAFALVWL